MLLQISLQLFESLDGSQNDLASWLCGSCWPYCEFDLSTTRGTLGDWNALWKSSSFVFVHTAFSLQAAGGVLKRTDWMWPCLVNLQSLALGRASNCTNIPYFEGVSKYSCMARSLVSSDRAEFLPCHIHFTAVKNTACLSVLRLFPPGINPFLIIEFNSLAFPSWLMYSVNPFGNNTLSCNSGSTAFSPECPWTARKYKNWLEKFGFMQHWNLFLAPHPPSARVDIHSSSGHCQAPSDFFFLHSSIMSLSWIVPWLFGTSKHFLIVWSLCFNVDPFSFKNKNRNGSQRYCGLLSWSCFSNGFLPSSVLFFLG